MFCLGSHCTTYIIPGLEMCPTKTCACLHEHCTQNMVCVCWLCVCVCIICTSSIVTWHYIMVLYMTYIHTVHTWIYIPVSESLTEYMVWVLRVSLCER